MYKAVGESGGAGAQASVPLPRGPVGQTNCERVTCITHNCGRLAGEAGGVNVLSCSVCDMFS